MIDNIINQEDLQTINSRTSNIQMIVVNILICIFNHFIEGKFRVHLKIFLIILNTRIIFENLAGLNKIRDFYGYQKICHLKLKGRKVDDQMFDDNFKVCVE